MQWATRPQWTGIRTRSTEPVRVGVDAAFVSDFNADIPDFAWDSEAPESDIPSEDLMDIDDARRSLADPSPRTSLADLRRELGI